MRESDYHFNFKGQTLILTPEKAVYWVEQKTLLLADLHLGKSGHFRKNGIAVPESVNDNNLLNLDVLNNHFEPDQIVFLGDLFHSDKNEEWESFYSWKAQYPQQTMHLAVGNHDHYSLQDYAQMGLNCSDEILATPFIFYHIPKMEDLIGNYPISGHIHPSVKLAGLGRQKINVPCFYFGQHYAILPAFGTFTGTHQIKPHTHDSVWAIVDNQVIKLN